MNNYLLLKLAWGRTSRLATGACLSLLALTFTVAGPNRTVPKVEPFRPALAFSNEPTAEEIFKARVFEEPLVSIGGKPAAAENRALASSLSHYASRSGADDFAGLSGFVSAHPRSKWAASLWVNLGIEYYNCGRYSKAINAWEQAWALSQTASAPGEKAVADRAVGELAYMYARLGRAAQLKTLFAEIEGRELTGSATERIAGAKQGLWTMENRPEVAFRCGPLALDRIRFSRDPQTAGTLLIQEARSGPNGFSLTEVARLSKELGMNYQMGFRQTGATFAVPAVVNWKFGHYAALIRREGNRYLLQDPTFGNDVWVTQAVLEDESSGYFLVPAGELPSRWRAVEEPEGNSVWGKGVTSNSDPDATTPDDIKKDPCHKSRGMAAYNVHLMVVSLNIEDTPVGYRPPVGPAIDFSVTYNQRDANQPATFAYSNLGQKWTFNWLAYIRDNPDNPAANVYYYVEGGGSLVFTGYDEVTQSFASQVREQTKLVRTSGNSYEMRFPDGSKKVFGQSDGATGTARRVFLTRIYDPYGNFVALTYDSNLRLVALTDAIGQVTTISYDHPSDIYKITKVTDPFGRFAAFSYTSNLLADITDTLGLHSQFTYSTNSFISAMTTPYGRTTFTMGELGRTRWLEATDPEGETERIEFSESESVGIRNAELASVVPKGLFTRNWVLYARNTYYWNKKAYAEARNDYTRARIYHWLHSSDYSSSIGVLESEKMPLENRVWYNYAGQPQNHEGATVPGSIDRPSVIGRVLEDGTTQLYQYGYNALGNVINTVDPLGRTFTSLYDANGVDLLEVRQTRGANHERLARFTYNSQHLPLTAVDAAGQTSTFTYNARGQLLTSTNPQGKVRTFSYDSNGYVVAFDDALPGTNDQVRLAYDSFGRVHSITNSDGYHLVFDYDVMDRLTNVVYPDGTFTAVTYDRLDPETSRDRLGRITRYAHNSLRKLVKIEDPLKRTTFFNWCGCGDLESIIDPLGRMTSWRRDIQSRIVAKRYADGSQILYNFENSTSRLQSQRDEKGQLTAYSYNPDDTIRQIAYPNALVPTASVTFAYDPDYPRVLSMQDGNGTTAYSYYPVLSLPSMGAGRLAAIDGPLPNDTILMQYDALGRITNQSINGVSGAIRFDPLGRLEAVATALGVFTNGYVLRTFLAS